MITKKQLEKDIEEIEDMLKVTRISTDKFREGMKKKLQLKATLTQTNEIIKLIEKEVMFKNPNENLSMSTLVFNQFIRDLLLKKIKGGDLK